MMRLEAVDIIVKAADKGGALVVWRADLYQKEALRQLSDTSLYAKVDKDVTSANQQIVKSTINDLIVKQELPATGPRLTSIFLTRSLPVLKTKRRYVLLSRGALRKKKNARSAKSGQKLSILSVTFIRFFCPFFIFFGV